MTARIYAANLRDTTLEELISIRNTQFSERGFFSRVKKRKSKIIAMTTDERLDRLTERHGVLAESLQLLTADVHGLAKRHEALAESLQLLTADVQSLAQSHEGIERIDERT
jgi:hypothetical protein